MKLKTVYVCEHCEHTTSKWEGKCQSCNNWNCLYEDVIDVKAEKVEKTTAPKKAATRLSETPRNIHGYRMSTGINEVDVVLGGGFVKGSINLIGGEPGIGKSTLMLQIANTFKDKNILYISGEESSSQVANRAARLSLNLDNVEFLETSTLEHVLSHIKETKPDFVIVDSIQVMSSDHSSGYAGSISQVRYCTETLMHYAKSNDVTIAVIGHVNKDGNLAGPKVLEHLVDSVFLIDGDRYNDMRILRCMKNRFGSTNEVGIFSMTSDGLKEISNPSELVLSDRKKGSIGSCLSIILEGTRPLVVEIQALTSVSAYGYPKRSVNGFDQNRLQMITAIIQKYTDVNLLNQDIYINVVGGHKVNDPAIDLAVALAIISSYKKCSLKEDTVALGEMGLTSEIRGYSEKEKRSKEAKKLSLKIIGPYKQLSECMELFS